MQLNNLSSYLPKPSKQQKLFVTKLMSIQIHTYTLAFLSRRNKEMEGQKNTAIVYAVIARGNIVLAEYSGHNGNFMTVVRTILMNLQKKPLNKATITYDDWAFHYILEDGIYYICMTDKGHKRYITFEFLQDIKRKFRASFGEAVYTAIAYQFNQEFNLTLQTQIEFFNSPNALLPGRVNQQMEEVKGIMRENIDSLLDRGEKVSLLVEKSDDVSRKSLIFNRQSREINRRFYWQKVRGQLLKYGMLLLVIGLIVFFISSSICGGLSYPKCKK